MAPKSVVTWLTRLRPRHARIAHTQQDADGLEAQGMLDEVSGKSQDEHDRRSIDKEIGSRSLPKNRVFDLLNPAIGSQLDRADQGVSDEQHEEQRRADFPTACSRRTPGKRRIPNRRKYTSNSDSPRRHPPVNPKKSMPVNPCNAGPRPSLKNKNTKKPTTAEPMIPTSRNISNTLSPFGRRLGFREALTEEHDRIEQGRNQEHSELNLPVVPRRSGAHSASYAAIRRAPIPRATRREEC